MSRRARQSKPSNYLFELINSGITLTEKEAGLVEEFLWANSETVTPYQFNSLKVRAGIGIGP